jgi:phosphohistidine phosphatase SixA
MKEPAKAASNVPLGWMLFLLPALGLCAPAAEPPLSGTQLIGSLAHGGYVILMRHANSPGTPPDAAQAQPDNPKHERQLDESGRASARSMGDAFRRLRIPVGEVLSSPTYRALETARLAQFPTPQTFDELGDAGKSMSQDAAGTRGAWLRSRVAQVPERGENTIIITHYPNIMEAFPDDAKDLSEGEALIFRPNGHGAALLVRRIKIETWPTQASAE